MTQPGSPYHFLTSVELQGPGGSRFERVEVREREASFTFHAAEKPARVRFNPGQDLLVAVANPFSLPNQSDDFKHLLIVPGTSRQVEANRSLALNYRDLLADNFTEDLVPVQADAEVSAASLREHDLIVFGGPDDNALLERMVRDHALPVTFGKGCFTFQGKTYGRAEDGLALALPNPYNPGRTLFLYTANSRLELWHMTHAFQRGLPGWVVYRDGEIVARGFGAENRFDLAVN